MNLEARLGRRFARLVTDLVVREPALWRVLRAPLRLQFERLAPRWDGMRMPDSLAAYEAALERLAVAPARALDVGTGTGAGAFAIARRFPRAEVVGVDVSEQMVAEAVRKTPAELADRVRFEVADAARLPFGAASFDLVTLANMIPFFAELARVLRRGGHVVIAFSSGPSTPIYVSAKRLRDELERRGFTDFAELSAGPGTGLLARSPTGA